MGCAGGIVFLKYIIHEEKQNLSVRGLFLQLHDHGF